MTDSATLPISDAQRRELEGLGVRVRFPANHVIFWEGQPSRSVLIIQEGHVAVTQTAEDGAEVFLATRGPGEVMGDEGALMGEPRSATVKAVSEVVGLDVTAGDLVKFVDKHNLWPDMYRNAIRRRRESDAERALLARLGVLRRFAHMLVDLAAEMGVKEGGRWEIAVALSQQDMASRVGASREAVAKVLRLLRDEGLVVTRHGKLTLLDLDGLRRIASGDR
ncbi:Crp/Fnr family transcriptional regulator [Streptomyces sp. WAC 00631]|uniref:Crp/Fnr family transcriptional regulator n=1 Tax=Streptomyces sp. WAC 00631 TaxID=2203201 RepID=UPI00163C495E|nr:Crp/Fnr family transcriptional regulator [Streptomyces sp. WAC 00631]MCC5033377.1 Crp/Fnr family transcriptional regulator [Streptomyces sp. WAC 00631]